MIPHIPETVESCFLFITIGRKECMEGASVTDFYQLTWSLIKIGSWSFIKFVKLKHIQEEYVLLSSFFCKITHIVCSSSCAQPRCDFCNIWKKDLRTGSYAKCTQIAKIIWLTSADCKETQGLIVNGNIAKGTTDPRVEFILQDHSSQFTNLEYITIPESQRSINFKITTKHQHLD